MGTMGTVGTLGTTGAVNPFCELRFAYLFRGECRFSRMFFHAWILRHGC